MQAIVKTQAGPGATLMDVPEPQITRSDQIKVRTLATSICGTDYHIYSWDKWAQGRVKPPRVIGHEFAGEIVAVGDEVSSFKVGDYVSGESHWTCGHCRQCRLNERHVCANTRILGVDVDGCFAPYVVVPQASAWRNERSASRRTSPAFKTRSATLSMPPSPERSSGRICRHAWAAGRLACSLLLSHEPRARPRSYATDTRDYRLGLARKSWART